MKKVHDKIRALLADPAALDATHREVFRHYDDDERTKLDKYDLFARMYLNDMSIESSDGDWEQETREVLAATLRLIGAGK